MILLNLFLAILINNFVESRKNYKDDGKKDILTFSLEGSISQVQDILKVLKEKTCKIFNRVEEGIEQSPTIEVEEQMLREVDLPRGCEDYHKNFDYRLFPVTIDLHSDHYSKLQNSESMLTRTSTKVIRLTGKSLFVLSNTNRFRLFLFKWLNHKTFKRSVMYVASCSAILYIFVNPLNDPRKTGNLALWILNQVM